MTAPTNGFSQKVLIVVLGVLATVLLGFFSWLAIAVIDIRERVARMEVSIASLIETRRDDVQRGQDSNTRRLEQLERRKQ